MTYLNVRNSILRIEREYNDITNYGTIQNLNSYFNLNNIDVLINHYSKDSFEYNKIIICIKRNINKQINSILLSKLICSDISNKIINYSDDFDELKFEIDIEYDTLYYPLCKGPTWRLVSLTNNGFILETEKAIKSLIEEHNKVLLYDWNCIITIRTDLMYFISKFIKIIKYI
jgi:hypothetical protein